MKKKHSDSLVSGKQGNSSLLDEGIRVLNASYTVIRTYAAFSGDKMLPPAEVSG